MDPGFGVDPSEREHGGEHVDEADLRLHAHALESLEGCRDDERDVQHVVVDEEAMRPLAMAAEAFAVIAGDDDNRASVQAGRPSATTGSDPTC